VPLIITEGQLDELAAGLLARLNAVAGSPAQRARLDPGTLEGVQGSVQVALLR
jgi:hypothetical protein